MIKNKVRFTYSLLTVCGLSLLTACGTGKGNAVAKETVTAVQTEEKAQGEGQKESQEETGALTDEEKEAEALLQNMKEAIEAQFPDQTFSDLDGLDGKVAGLSYKDSYLFGGRSSSEGWQYIAGVCKTSDNPLEGMSCGTATVVSEFSTSQFDNGRIILMEKNGGENTGLSYLYDVLQLGGRGISHMIEAAARDVRLVPPETGAFLKVSTVKEGVPLTEFIPLTDGQAEELRNGTPSDSADGHPVRGLALCGSRDELAAAWNGSDGTLTEEMFSLAGEKCGFKTGNISDIRDLSRAVLRITANGETREETLENRSDLDLIKDTLSKASYDEYQPSGRYDGILTLTNQDGSEVTVQLASFGGGCVLNDSVLLNLGEEDTDRLWSVFTTIDGFRKYGDSISLSMTKKVFAADEENLTFTLNNDTGKPIQYILAPIIYKKEGDSWKRMDSIAGFCGFVTDLEGETADLTVPWKDAFELDGAGTYRIEIGVMPEPDMRFDISAAFELTV